MATRKTEEGWQLFFYSIIVFHIFNNSIMGVWNSSSSLWKIINQKDYNPVSVDILFYVTLQLIIVMIWFKIAIVSIGNIGSICLSSILVLLLYLLFHTGSNAPNVMRKYLYLQVFFGKRHRNLCSLNISVNEWIMLQYNLDNWILFLFLRTLKIQ